MTIADKYSYKMRTIGPFLQSLVFLFLLVPKSKEPGRTVRKADLIEALSDVFVVNSREGRGQAGVVPGPTLSSSKIRCGPHLLWDVCRSCLTSFSSFVKVSIFLCSCIIDVEEYLAPISFKILLFCLEISQKLGLCTSISHKKHYFSNYLQFPDRDLTFI